MQIEQDGAARSWGWSLLAAVFLMAMPLLAHSGDNETRAVAYCVAQGAVEPVAFTYCVGSALTAAEIKKCLTGGDCFGESNDLRRALENTTGINFDHIRQYGWCGGPNSAARAIFGSGACGCGGPERSVRIENRTNQTVYFNVAGSCSDSTAHSVPVASTVTLTGGGDEWFNVTVSSDGGTVAYGLDIGMTYAFEWQGNRLEVFNVTPRYNP